MRSIRLHRAVVAWQLCGLCGNDTVSELINGCIDKVEEGLHDLEHSGCALQSGAVKKPSGTGWQQE